MGTVNPLARSTAEFVAALRAGTCAIVTSIKDAIGDFGGTGDFGAAAAVLTLRSRALPLLGALRTADPGFALRFTTPYTRTPENGFDTAPVSGSPRGGARMTLLFRRACS